MSKKQLPLFSEPVDPYGEAGDRVLEAFQDRERKSGFLPIAEAALNAFPDDDRMQLFAATAALLDKHPGRALAVLARVDRRSRGPSWHLLQALALHESGKTAAAQALLRADGRIRDSWEAARFFPAVHGWRRWLMTRYDAITGKHPTSRRTTAPATKAKPEKKPPAQSRKLAPEPPSKEAPAPPPPLPRVDIELPFDIDLDLGPFLAIARGEPEHEGRWYGLRERFAHLGLAQGFDELLCLPHLTGVEPLWHQIESVRKVLRQFRGRVLLADEVGLGKTIEACMVLKEYLLRGMVERVLILTPASLVGQWREELESKFAIEAATTQDTVVREDADAFWRQKRIVASLALARRREHADRLLAQNFDLVIVDEAHHLRDRSSASYKLVDGLNKRFLLLLSATPVQNDLIELYNLLTLLKPGIFKTQKEFRQAYMMPGKSRRPANPERLRELMRSAMIRNTRAVVALKLPRRHASTLQIEPSDPESAAYADLAAIARDLAGEGGRNRMALHHLLSAAGSSPAAAAGAVRRYAERHPGKTAWASLARQWEDLGTGAKETALMDLLRRNPAEKKLVFVHARETLERLAALLHDAKIAFARFDGSLSGRDKDAAIAAFRDEVPVLLCTESGGEGRNMQFCNTLINFDVPWNPMAIEQRIGRIDRIGQDREVFVFNLVTSGTLEERVLTILEEKISMFELVVGEVGAIVGGLEEEREFSDLMLDAWLQTTEESRTQAFDDIGRRLDEAREQHEGAKALDDALFGEDFETG